VENPATWTPAERIVREVMRRPQYRDGQPIIGLSLERQITDALRAAGLLRESAVASDGEDQAQSQP
jgi:hypothetical protein